MSFNPFQRDRRREPRQMTVDLATPFGEVLDLSPDGALLFRKGLVQVSIGDELSLHIEENGIELDVRCRVVRVHEVGMRRHEVGVEFIDTREAERYLLRAVMRACGTDYSPRVYLAA